MAVDLDDWSGSKPPSPRCRRANALIDTLHPSYEGRAFRWRSDSVEEPEIDYLDSKAEGAALRRQGGTDKRTLGHAGAKAQGRCT